MSELLRMGFSTADLHDGGFRALELLNGGSSTADLKAVGHSAGALREIGLGASELLAVGFSVAALRVGGFGAAVLVEAGGVRPNELKEGGFSAAQLRTLGLGLRELKGLGFDAKELKQSAGFKAREMAAHGFARDELRDGGFTRREAEAVTGKGRTPAPPVDELYERGYAAGGDRRDRRDRRDRILNRALTLTVGLTLTLILILTLALAQVRRGGVDRDWLQCRGAAQRRLQLQGDQGGRVPRYSLLEGGGGYAIHMCPHTDAICHRHMLTCIHSGVPTWRCSRVASRRAWSKRSMDERTAQPTVTWRGSGSMAFEPKATLLRSSSPLATALARWWAVATPLESSRTSAARSLSSRQQEALLAPCAKQALPLSSSLRRASRCAICR